GRNDRQCGDQLFVQMKQLIFAISALLMGLLLLGEPGMAVKRGPLDDGANGISSSNTAPAPGLFTAGTGSAGINYLGTGGVRPPWRVAGVDYYVGYEPATGSLTNPSGFSSGCATLASFVITVNSGPCTINGFDFSLSNGYRLVISGS